MLFSRHRLVTLLRLLIHTPRKVRNWPSVLTFDIRGRLGKPGHPANSEIRLRNGLVLGMYPNSGGLYPVFTDVYLLSCYDRGPQFQIGPSDTIIDIGANVGFFTAKASVMASEGRVFAFEPCPPHFDLLRDNVKRNELKNVVISSEALWSSEGTIEIRYSETDGNLQEPLNTSVFEIGGDRVVVVPTISLDQVMAREEITRCSFLKIDCEGAEYEILYGASPETLNAIDRIAMEWHIFSPEHDPARLARHLQSCGFHVELKHSSHPAIGYIFARRTQAGNRSNQDRGLELHQAKDTVGSGRAGRRGSRAPAPRVDRAPAENGVPNGI